MFSFLEFGERIGKRIKKNREEVLLEASMRVFFPAKGKQFLLHWWGSFGGAGRKRFQRRYVFMKQWKQDVF